ncbi:hypothetical protein [Pseudaestuariivita sp.]|uniref:hypothetical protein n=1 Tax=Pseudaestuariivita sp. TaxID=2211669 RepID=UPI00405A0844
MPLALTGLALGALLGAFVAWRRKGKITDILQYAAGYGIFFALIGMIAAITIFRMAG